MAGPLTGKVIDDLTNDTTQHPLNPRCPDKFNHGDCASRQAGADAHNRGSLFRFPMSLLRSIRTRYSRATNEGPGRNFIASKVSEFSFELSSRRPAGREGSHRGQTTGQVLGDA